MAELFLVNTYSVLVLMVVSKYGAMGLNPLRIRLRKMLGQVAIFTAY